MIPRLNNLIEIASFLNENHESIDLGDAEIVYRVPRKGLQKINEDIYYRNNEDGQPEDNPDEVNVVIQGIHFKYIPEE